MTVEIRQAGAEWLVEVHGEPIGKAYSAVEALELAVYWEWRLDCVATWRVEARRSRHCPTHYLGFSVPVSSRLEIPRVLITSMSLLALNHQHNCEEYGNADDDHQPRKPWVHRILLRRLRPICSVTFSRAHIRNVFAKGGGEIYLMVLLVDDNLRRIGPAVANSPSASHWRTRSSIILDCLVLVAEIETEYLARILGRANRRRDGRHGAEIVDLLRDDERMLLAPHARAEAGRRC